jgi:hypothetical protein
MRKVSEYREHAKECRQLARQIKDPAHQKQLEEMAQAWDMLAAERTRQLGKINNSMNPILRAKSVK